MPAANSAFSSVQQLGFSPEQLRRLNTWCADIALDLRKGAPSHIGSKGELRIGRKGSLAIYPAGDWFDYTHGIWGGDAASLILHLMDASPVEARVYAIQWLATHPGNGTFSATPLSDSAQVEKDRQNTEYAREVLGRVQAVTESTATHTYLERRGLLGGPLPACVGHLDSGRQHESAIVGVLTDADGAVTGVQLGHLLADGGKSPYEPQRNHYLLDRERARDAAFRIPAAAVPDDSDVAELVRALADTVLIAEGLEDALSLTQAFPFSAVWGVPGIGRLQHLKVPKGTNFLVFADGDAADSAAHASLVKGLDHLLLEGAASVLLTNSPPGSDANDLLVQGGITAIHAVAATAGPAVLSQKGHYLRAARTADDVYELNRKSWAKEAGGIRVSVLDRERDKRRRSEQPETPSDGLHIGDDTPWPAPVTDITAVCDKALAEVQRYVIANEDDLAVMVMWGLGAHFVHHQTIHLTRYPRLEIGGEDVEVGKTTALEIVGALVPRALPIGGSITAAAYYRLVDAHQASVLIDEAHDLFKSKDGSQSHLLRILRSGHTRTMAYVLLTEPSPDGKHVLRQFSTWTAIAYTVIGRLPDAGTRSRAISIRLIRALEGEVRADFDEGDSPILDVVRQKFTRWAADQTELPMVPRPSGIFNRRWNNWAPLMRVAALVGGEWSTRLARAAQRALIAPAPSNSDGAVAALTDIRDIFDTPKHGKLRDQIASEQLCQEMADLEEPSAEWKRIHRGQPITPLYLRERLRGLLNPPGSRQLQQGTRNVRGYKRTQFEDAFRRYLPTKAPNEDAPDIIFAPPPARPAGPADPLTPSPESQDFGGFSGSAGESAGPDSRPADSPADPISRPKARPSEGESAGQRVAAGRAGPSAEYMSDPNLRPPWEAEEAAAPAAPETPSPAPHVFPDGVTTPWDGPSTPAEDPKKEELW